MLLDISISVSMMLGTRDERITSYMVKPQTLSINREDQQRPKMSEFSGVFCWSSKQRRLLDTF